MEENETGLNERWEAGVDCMPGSTDRFFLMLKELDSFRLEGPDTGESGEGYTRHEVFERLAEYGYSPSSMLILVDAALHRAEHAPKPEGVDGGSG